MASLKEIALKIIENKNASTQFVERNFDVDYNRASKIMDELVELEIIGPFQASRKRDILMNKEQVIVAFNTK